MSRIGDSGFGPVWPSSLPEDEKTEGAGKSEFDKALERQQRGLLVNPNIAVPPADNNPVEGEEQDENARVTPSRESGAGDNQDHGKDDPYADVDWRIRRQLDI